MNMRILCGVLAALSAGTVSASWITHPDMADLTPRNVEARQLARQNLAPVDTRHQNRHYLFRRTFELGAVRSATLRITADDYYKLYVNGAFVAMGPAAGTVDCTYYNVIDLTPHLKPGSNTIAVHTYYQGLVNRVWVSGDNRHGLWLELDADGRRVLESDAAFKVRRHSGYAALGKAGYDTQFLECYDAGAPEVGFAAPGFDDAAWIAAVPHPRGGDYRLVEQPSPMVMTERIAPSRVERLPDGGLRAAFGGVYVGSVTFAASGKRGDAVEILCGQELNADGSVRHKLRANCDYVEKMVLSGGTRDVLEQFDYKSFRYLELHPSPGVAIDEGSVALVARHQPFELKAKPVFDDPALQPVWDLCVDSFRYGVQEQIMDCMEREKGYYLGDGCYTMLTYCLLTQDWRQARKFFDDFLRTKRIDRGLVTCANCSFMQEIAEYPFMMMLFADWYLELTGDTAFVAERFDALADVVDSYRERYARADGLLCNLDKWCVVEWPRNFQDGYDADVREGKVCTDVHNVINAWYVIAVRSLNAIAARLGRRPYADVTRLEDAFRAAFWDAGRHLFVDREGSSHVSLPGNVYASFGQLAPRGDAAAHAAFLELVKEKRYSSISLFQFFPLFVYLRATGEEALLHDLLAAPEAWRRILREGGTRTFEGWGRDTKWNTSLFHLTLASAAVFLTDVRLAPPGFADARKIAGLTRPKPARDLSRVPAWQRRFRTFRSTGDGSVQPFYWYDPGVTNAVPLAVVLHSWGASCNWDAPGTTVLAYCQSNAWAMVYANYRGPNVRPEACGSELAVQDVMDAIAWAKAARRIDGDRVYVIGGSGGGHMSLLMAGRHPEVFAGAAAFCPITDLERWRVDSSARKNHYAGNIETCCGGTPETARAEYANRSPLTHLPKARACGLAVYIATGIHDGHTGSVPVGHAIRAFNALADEKDRVSESDIAYLEANEAAPANLRFTGCDPFYTQKNRIHLRRTSANARLTIFEGGHAGNYPAGLDFLSRQRRGRPMDAGLPATAGPVELEAVTK